MAGVAAAPAERRHVGIGIGETLRSEREQQGRSLEEAARDIRVRSDYLRALEEEDFDVFGGDVYAKGFLTSYARYLRLDPEPLLETYRRYVQVGGYSPTQLATRPVAQPAVRQIPPWVLWAAGAAVVLAIALGLSNLIEGRNPTPAADRPVSPPPAAASPSPVPRTPSPRPSPSPTFEGVELAILVDEPCWMRVEIDGQPAVERTFQPGESVEFQGQEQVTIRFGNPGGVRVVLNGRDLGAPGGRGEPVTVRFTPEGASEPGQEAA